MKKYLLFDLDGTLTDPKVGITTCVQYALQSFGVEEADPDKLECFIGPPLRDSFMEFYGFGEEQAKEAVEKYRERFQDTGIYENELYDGIPQMLRTLQSKGMYLAVASSKPEEYVRRILEHFKIDKYFCVVVGSEMDGARSSKAEVIREVLARLSKEEPIQADQVYMVGDRRHDIEGARENGIESVGVAYGYGSMEELKEAKSDYIVRSVEELQKFLLRGSEEQASGQKKKNPMTQRIWTMAYCFLMFMLVRNVVLYALSWLLVQVGGGLSGVLADFLLIKDEAGEMIGYTGNTSTIMSALAFLAGIVPVWPTAKKLIHMTEEDTKLSHLKKEPNQHYILIALAAAGAVVGLNLLFDLTGFTSKSDAYQAVMEDQYSAYFLVGIFCYGVISPIAEEILFRGVFFAYMRRFLTLKLAIVLSSALFGFYHMNAVQGIYAFAIGCLIAYSYEYFGNFLMPVAVHMISNLLSYCLSYTGLAQSGFMSWPVCVASLVICAGSLHMLGKAKKIL
ncbi:MAG: HAD hydrolase-like protein [Candidatus Gastranaerophilales bacterium]|nr:HAD hydrolase-like protein [Candidatus Gastranaerophilales bacterium]